MFPYPFPTAATLDADDAAVGEHELIDHEPLPELRPSLDGCAHEHPVESAAAWTEADRHAVDDQLVPGEREVAEID